MIHNSPRQWPGKRFKKKNGFTLIEIIVAITIIAVVTAVAAVSFAGTNKRARDSRRMADLEKIRVALEMAKQIGATYPASLGMLVTGGYIQNVPSDPRSNAYRYERGASSNYVYDLYAVMEDIGNTNYTGGIGCTATCNYRVSSP
jgi:general secretion pathway protein G